MLVFFAYLFSFIALFNAFKFHDKFDPAKYFLLFWSLQIIVIYAVFHNTFRFQVYGLIFISVTCLLFSFGSILGRVIGNNMEKSTYVLIFHPRRALNVLKVLFAISLFKVLYDIYKTGFNILDLASFNILLELNSTASANRYTSDVQNGLLTQFGLVFMYLTPLLGGFLIPLIKKNQRIWCYLSLVPSMIGALTQAVKLGLITSIALLLAGMLISTFANNKSFIKINFRTAFRFLIYGSLFFVILFLSMIFRTGRFDVEIIKEIGHKFINYAFGHLPAFDIWFSKNIDNFEILGGIKTFYGISNFIGLAERKQGAFTDLINFSTDNWAVYSTNVYTAFRFLLEDFGFIGTLFFIFLIGIISGGFYEKIKRNKDLITSQVIIISVLFFISLSFATSVWAYTSYIVTFIFFYIILHLIFSKSVITR